MRRIFPRGGRGQNQLLWTPVSKSGNLESALVCNLLEAFLIILCALLNPSMWLELVPQWRSADAVLYCASAELVLGPADRAGLLSRPWIWKRKRYVACVRGLERFLPTRTGVFLAWAGLLNGAATDHNRLMQRILLGPDISIAFWYSAAIRPSAGFAEELKFSTPGRLLCVVLHLCA